MLFGDDRSEVARGITARADLQFVDAIGDLGDQSVCDVAHRDHDADGHAALARGAEARVDRGVRGDVEVRAGQDDHVVLRTTERLDPLVVGRTSLVDVTGDGRRANETDGVDSGVHE